MAAAVTDDSPAGQWDSDLRHRPWHPVACGNCDTSLLADARNSTIFMIQGLGRGTAVPGRERRIKCPVRKCLGHNVNRLTLTPPRASHSLTEHRGDVSGRWPLSDYPTLVVTSRRHVSWKLKLQAGLCCRSSRRHSVSCSSMRSACLFIYLLFNIFTFHQVQIWGEITGSTLWLTKFPPYIVRVREWGPVRGGPLGRAPMAGSVWSVLARL